MQTLSRSTSFLNRRARHGINGAVLSAGLDALSRRSPDYFRRLGEVEKTCNRLKLELIPAIFSVGYGSPALGFNRMLAEGIPVIDAPFLVKGSQARLVPDASVKLANPSFEEVSGNRFKGYNFHDQPGEISFADTAIKHSGNTSLRMENFSANPHGHGRVMQEIHVRPHRCYRMSVWVKTEDLQPAGAFRMLALANGRELAPREFNVPRHERLARAQHAGQQPRFRRDQPLCRRLGREEGQVLARRSLD